MPDRKSFLLYTDYRQHLELLTDEERGKLFIALFDYAEKGTIPDFGGMAQMAFSFIKSQIDRDSEKYKSKCEKNRENAAKRWNSSQDESTERIQTDANACDGKKRNANHADTDNDNENDTDITPIAPKGATRFNYDLRFAKFWAAYPKKVGKGAAEKSFKKYKPDDDLTDAILKAIELQKRSEQWKKDSGQYIPNPATYLNQRRWEDEPVCNTESSGKEIPYLT